MASFYAGLLGGVGIGFGVAALLPKQPRDTSVRPVCPGGFPLEVVERVLADPVVKDYAMEIEDSEEGETMDTWQKYGGKVRDGYGISTGLEPRVASAWPCNTFGVLVLPKFDAANNKITYFTAPPPDQA
jgi:hypothetical protein